MPMRMCVDWDDLHIYDMLVCKRILVLIRQEITLLWWRFDYKEKDNWQRCCLMQIAYGNIRTEAVLVVLWVMNDNKTAQSNRS